MEKKFKKPRGLMRHHLKETIFTFYECQKHKTKRKGKKSTCKRKMAPNLPYLGGEMDILIA